ncbi:Os02g0777950, partial [Oryza sativa Japonica Group]
GSGQAGGPTRRGGRGGPAAGGGGGDDAGAGEQVGDGGEMPMARYWRRSSVGTGSGTMAADGGHGSRRPPVATPAPASPARTRSPPPPI